jgi:uncharacterized cupredoxin-like copper-binding protein
MAGRSVATSLLAASLVAGCAKGTPAPEGSVAPANVVTVEATEYSYSLPDQATGGVVTLQLANVGSVVHEFAFGRIDAGKTLDDVKAALDSGKDPSNFPWAHDLAGVSALTPGQQVAVTRTLADPGTYVFFCFIPNAEGVSHYKLGMIAGFTLAGTSNASLPKADATITATDDGFQVPALTAGTTTVELKNAGKKEHEFQLFSFEPGKGFKDVERWIGRGQVGPAPVVFPGGIQTIPAGTSVFEELTLESGRTYMLQDFEHNLMTEFTVT